MNERFEAVLTLERLLSSVHAYMGLHVLQFGVESSTVVARQDLVLSERLHVANVDFLVSFIRLVVLFPAMSL